VLPLPLAVVVQGAVFAAFHANPAWGAGNVGLLAVLATIGVVLGAITVLCGGRLGGSMTAHGLHNLLAFSIALGVLG
jgi:hypothetical protein